MSSGKRKSIIALVLFLVFLTGLLTVLMVNLYREIRTDRLDAIRTDSYVPGEWIRDSSTASSYLLESMIGIIPPDLVVYPPGNTQIYSDNREIINHLRLSFPFTHLAGIVDEEGILTHSLYHDGMDMKPYGFYGELLTKPAGSSLLSDAFQMEDGDWVVCHALKSEEPGRNLMAVMMIDLDYFKSWLDKRGHESEYHVFVIDRAGHILAGEAHDSEVGMIEELVHHPVAEHAEEGSFQVHSEGRGEFHVLRQIRDLPYAIVYHDPEMFSFKDIILPAVLIIAGYFAAFVLGILVFRSHVTQIELNQDLAQAHDELEIYFNNSLIGIVIFRGGRIVSKVNQRVLDIFGYESEEEVIGSSVEKFHISPESAEKFGEMFYDTLLRHDVFQAEYPFKAADGSRIWLSASGRALDHENPPDLRKGLLWILEDITERHAAVEKLKELADTDPMTGIANHRNFMDSAEREFSIFLRHHRPLAVMMLDIDHFKNVNDRFGHAVGDQAILLAVDICQRNLRAGDLFGRVGGEEFAFVLPDTELRDAETVAERIRGMIESETVNRDDGIPSFTVSLGIAKAAGGSIETLLQNADKALYKAKKGGRNRVCRF